jgi:catechol 2,3-dioxygenase-like lactoylglutathione lyase family enzyme
MPAITDRSTKAPLLKTGMLNHGTLHVRDIAKSRRFYEEVLGIECIQTSPLSLMIRKGTAHVYAVVEQPAGMHPPMTMLNHNGFEVSSVADVEAAHKLLAGVKDEYGIKKIMPLSQMHGDTSFYFQDQDDNWWEIVAVREGGYVADFDDKATWDMTGHHEVDGFVDLFIKEKKLRHMHDPETRAQIKAAQKT